MSTAILDLNPTWEMRWKYEEEQRQLQNKLHWSLVREVEHAHFFLPTRYEEMRLEKPLHFFELPGPSLRWEWRICDVAVALCALILFIVTFYPLVYGIQSVCYERRRPQSLDELAREHTPWKGLA